MTTESAQLAPIFDVDAPGFQTDVLDASHGTAVLVDFWAAWCGPCKALGPVLEKVVAASNGVVRLAKMDIDANQEFAASNGIRSIPTVRLFVNGAAVAEFMGAQPEQAIRAFLEQHLADATPAEAPHAVDVQHKVEAMLNDGQFEQATQTIAQLSESERAIPAMQVLAARVLLATSAARFPAIDVLESRLKKDADNLESRLALGTRQAARGDYDQAMESLLLVLARNRNFSDGAARKTLLTTFDALGADDERVNRFRAMLASVLN